MAKFTYAVGYYAAQKLCEEVKDPKAVSSLSELADKVCVCMNNIISTVVIKTMVDRILALRRQPSVSLLSSSRGCRFFTWFSASPP